MAHTSDHSLSFFVLFRFFSVTSVILAIDQFTKYVADTFLATRGSVALIEGVFHLTLVHNKGAAFGIMKGGSLLFIAMTLLCLTLILALLGSKELFKKIFGFPLQGCLVYFALALIFGGSCGNLIDRFRFSYVIDFLDFRVWPVFNVADSCITIGGVVLFLKMIGKPKSVVSG